MGDVISAWLLPRRALRDIALRSAVAGLIGLLVGSVAGNALGHTLLWMAVAAVLDVVERRARPGALADHARACAALLPLLPLVGALALLQADYARVALRHGSGAALGEVVESLRRAAIVLAWDQDGVVRLYAPLTVALAAATFWRLRSGSPARERETLAMVLGLGVGAAAVITSVTATLPSHTGSLLAPAIDVLARGTIGLPFVAVLLDLLDAATPWREERPIARPTAPR